MTDGELLQDYVRSGSQTAFAELVRRHTDWIYCAAVRLVRQASLAEDVVQAVFIVLARKAETLPSSVMLNQWLFGVMRYSAIHALREESRRRRRECRAADWAASERSQNAESAEDWNQIVDRLDAATARLGGADRQVVLLRFYQRKSMAEVGLALGVSEDAAKKRVAKAIERLRGLLSAKGAAPPTATLGAVLLAHTTSAAPPALVKSVAVAGNGSGQAAFIAKGAIQMMIVTQIRHVAAIALMAIVPVGIVGAIATIEVARSTPVHSAAQRASTSPAVVAAATTQSGESPHVQAIRLAQPSHFGMSGRVPDAGKAVFARRSALQIRRG